jgi:GntR family transcriptional regulator, transcriptional repressor for pyruvate dehydrogenase complex
MSDEKIDGGGTEDILSGVPNWAKRAQKHVRVPKTAELVAGQIRRQIIRGEVAEGEALEPEPSLMKRFGVSRPTMREAFRILESEALIRVSRGARGGARAMPPAISVVARYAGLLLQYAGVTLEDVQKARTIVEPPAARMLAERRDLDAAAQLRELIEHERKFTADEEAFAELSTRFHEYMMELAGNQTLAMVVGMLHDIIEAHTENAMRVGFDESSTQRSIRSQEKLVRLIEAGDADGAEAHWRRHLRRAGQSILYKAGQKTVLDLFD